MMEVNITTENMGSLEKVPESALLVIVGEWECSSDGCWKFVVEPHCLAQCVMVSERMSYRDLKKLIEVEFQSEGEGFVSKLSYSPPAEMSMFATGKTPPVSINSDSGLATFFKLRASTKPLNLLVTFAPRWENDTPHDKDKQSSSSCPVINLADGTPSLFTQETVHSTYHDVGTGTDGENQYQPEEFHYAQSNGSRNGVIDWNTIYDAAMVARLEKIEEMARKAQCSRVSKGKEKVTYMESRGLECASCDEFLPYGRVEEEAYDNCVWSNIVSNEYRALQIGEPMLRGESSNVVRMLSFPESLPTGLGTGDEVASLVENIHVVVDEEEEDASGGESDVDEVPELDDDIQLSLVNIYNEIIEADVVPSHDCLPCFGDEFLQTEETSQGLHDLENDTIFIGRIFWNKAEMQTALALYAIRRFFTFKQTRSDKDRLIVRCVDKKCRWRVDGHTAGGTSQNMEVRTAILTHTCDINTQSQYGKKASCKVIAEVLKSKYANGKLGPRAVDIPDIVLDEFRVSITYMKAWHAKEKAVLAARGSAEDSYKLLLVYLHLLKQTNPRSLCKMVSTGVGTAKCKFKYLFFALGACIHAEKFMHRVVIINATTIKAKFRGCLLTTSFQDRNFQIMPLGFGVVDGENEEAWSRFFKQLATIVDDADDLVFVSDRHSSIYASLRKVYPRAKHGACAVHLYRNVLSRYNRQNGLAFVVAKAAAAYTVGEFRNKFDEIERRSFNCENYLRGIGISHWSRVYFEGKRYNIMSSNVAECLNAAIAKALEFPIFSMVETIRMILMRWFYCRRVKANKNMGPVTPEVESMLMKNLSESGGLSVAPASEAIYQVSNGEGNSVTVDLHRKTCSCKVFDSVGIPYCHALAAGRAAGVPIPDLVEAGYHSETWRNAYSAVVMPVPNSVDEDIPEEMMNSGPLPPQTFAGPGRPKKKRIPSVGENSGRKRARNGPSRCGRCFGTGHNRATCKNPIP